MGTRTTLSSTETPRAVGGATIVGAGNAATVPARK